MPAFAPTGLPFPSRLASALIRFAWREDAEAVAGDLAEALDRAETGVLARWLWGWSQVVRSCGHGVTSEASRRRPRLRFGIAAHLAFRGLVRDPGTSLTTSAILALGLASATTFFALLDGLDRPLPSPEGERIMRIDVVQPERDGRAVGVTGADLERWRDLPALTALGGSRSFPTTLRDPGRGVASTLAAAITPEALALLRVAPLVGRIPEGPDAEGAILIRRSYFDQFFNGDLDALGRIVELDGMPGTLAAILPDDFGFPIRHSLWRIERPAAHPDTRYDPVARLADGAGPALAAEQLQTRWTPHDDARPVDDIQGVVRVRPYTEGRGESGEIALFAGLALIGVSLLLIACANAANLLVVRATARVHLLGVQAALGAGRTQLAIQLLLESLGLAMAGGVAGLGLATVATNHVQRTMGPENFGYYWTRIVVDAPVVAFTAALVLGAALLAGTLPVLRVLRSDLHAVLKAGSRSETARGGIVSRLFVGSQLALSCAALVAAGLTARSMSAARDFGSALPSHEVVLAAVALDRESATARRVTLRDLAQAAAHISGARMATVSLGAPGFREPFGPVDLDGVEVDPDVARPTTGANAVGLDYFTLFDLELRLGRAFTAADGIDAEPVAIVNEAFVARHWPTGSPLGRRLRLATVGSDRWARVVGVVQTAPLGEGPGVRNDRAYRPIRQVDTDALFVVARAANGDGEGLAAPLRAALADGAPDVPIGDLRTLASGHAFMTRAQSTFSMLAASGGSAGLLVAIVGLYALLAFRVRRRRRELGVRKALGADGPTLVREVLGVAFRQLAPATLAGLAMAWLATPVLTGILLGGDPHSPLVFAGTALVFVGAGLGAALVPALRAGRVEPASVLRSE